MEKDTIATTGLERICKIDLKSLLVKARGIVAAEVSCQLEDQGLECVISSSPAENEQPLVEVPSPSLLTAKLGKASKEIEARRKASLARVSMYQN
jgi:hypothetical protein